MARYGRAAAVGNVWANDGGRGKPQRWPRTGLRTGFKFFAFERSGRVRGRRRLWAGGVLGVWSSLSLYLGSIARLHHKLAHTPHTPRHTRSRVRMREPRAFLVSFNNLDHTHITAASALPTAPSPPQVRLRPYPGSSTRFLLYTHTHTHGHARTHALALTRDRRPAPPAWRPGPPPPTPPSPGASRRGARSAAAASR